MQVSEYLFVTSLQVTDGKFMITVAKTCNLQSRRLNL